MMSKLLGLLAAVYSHIAIICMAFGLIAAADVLIAWTAGFWLNGLYGYRFPVESCWQGISAIGMGLVGLFKWLVDSSKNSPAGQFPSVASKEDKK